ncbi:hypothetical protein ACFXTN_031890 [Malus domestica]
MYVVHPYWLRPRNRGVLINCEGCGIFSGSTLPPSRGGIFNWWRCTRRLPSRRARRSAERGDRQGKQSELQAISPRSEL